MSPWPAAIIDLIWWLMIPVWVGVARGMIEEDKDDSA